MKKLQIILIVLFVLSIALIASISTSSTKNKDANNAAIKSDSYSAFDMVSKYNLY